MKLIIQILTIFQNIVQKGISANLMKVGSKRRRTKNEIEEQKQEEVLKQQKLEADLQELADLRARVQAAEDRAINNEGAA